MESYIKKKKIQYLLSKDKIGDIFLIFANGSLFLFSFDNSEELALNQ